MSLQFSSEKAQKTPTRKLRFLPRLAVVVDIAGRQFTFKQIPVLETIANMKRKDFSFKNFSTISKQILNEISIGEGKKSPSKKRATKKIRPS